MFQGFSQGAIDFLWGIRFNNERGWFLAHKEEFLTLVDAPMRELAAQMSQAMTEEFPQAWTGAEGEPYLPGCPAALWPRAL